MSFPAISGESVAEGDRSEKPENATLARYFDEAQSWDSVVNRSVRASRNAWRAVSVVLGLCVVTSLGLLWALLPLKSFDVVTLLVDKTTGFVEVAEPLERTGPLSQNEALLRANIVRYIRARETYDPRALRDNYDLAELYSTGAAAKDLQEEFSDTNPTSLIKRYGADTTISVFVKSVIFLNKQTAAVRFDTTEKNAQSETLTSHWVANVRFRYTSEPLRNDWRFDNPLGFQVFEYRRDQETVTSEEGTAK
jgi:type IV secretion system protein VirB8